MSVPGNWYFNSLSSWSVKLKKLFRSVRPASSKANLIGESAATFPKCPRRYSWASFQVGGYLVAIVDTKLAPVQVVVDNKGSFFILFVNFTKQPKTDSETKKASGKNHGTSKPSWVHNKHANHLDWCKLSVHNYLDRCKLGVHNSNKTPTYLEWCPRMHPWTFGKYCCRFPYQISLR